MGLDTFLFCGATSRSADPGGSGTGRRKTSNHHTMGKGLVQFTAQYRNLRRLKHRCHDSYEATLRKSQDGGKHH